MADYKGNADLPGQKRLRALRETGSIGSFKQATPRRKCPRGVPFQLALRFAVVLPIASQPRSQPLNQPRWLFKRRQYAPLNPFTPDPHSEHASDFRFAG